MSPKLTTSSKTYKTDYTTYLIFNRSAALKLFLLEEKERPLFAQVAFDNKGSIRVLEKCGFKERGNEKYFAKARGEEITEYLYRLD